MNRGGRNFMNECTKSIIPAAALLAMLAVGCMSSGREQSSRNGGPSPSFGLNYVPQQSEPPVEGLPGGSKSTVSQTSLPRIDATPVDLDEVAGDRTKTGNKLVSWLQDKKSAERRPLPLSARSAVANDDERPEP
jgi:hypothetical protein